MRQSMTRLRRRVEALESRAAAERFLAAGDVEGLLAWLERQGRPTDLDAVLGLMPDDLAEAVRGELRSPVVVPYAPGERPTPPDADERTVIYLPNKGDGGDLTALSDDELDRLARGAPPR